MNPPEVLNKHTMRAYKPNEGMRERVYIGRGSPWGNPFVIGKDGTRDQVCDMFQKAFLANPRAKEQALRQLVGKDLVCFCKPQRCHGDFLLAFITNPESFAPKAAPRTPRKVTP